MADPIRLLQVTDMHLQEDPKRLLRGADVEQRFLHTMTQIAQQEADLLLLTGDLSHHAPAAYSRLDQQLQTLPFPSRWLPGNHDLSGEMLQYAAQGYGEKIVELGSWKLIFLDSSAAPDGCGSGSLSEPELEFLALELEQTATDRHILLLLHHHPVAIGSRWQDQIGLGNAEQFWSVVDGYPQVRAVIFGHVHQAHQLQRAQVKLFSIPATAAQFKAGTDEPEAELDPVLAGPAYGCYQLFSDGEIRAEVIRLA